MRYLFFLLTLLPVLLNAQSTNKNVKFSFDDFRLRNNKTGKIINTYNLNSKQLITALGGNPIVKGRPDQMTPIKDIIYGKDTLTYEWDYNAHDDGFHEIGFRDLTLHTPNFSIGDARNNTFITVGDNAQILKKWFPKLNFEHSQISKVFENPIPKFNGVQFDWVGPIKDTKTGKWLSDGYIWVRCKKNNNNQWIISKIETFIFGDTQLVD